MRRRAAGGAVAASALAMVLTGLTAGCSSDDEPEADPAKAASVAAVGWSPCDGLDAADVSTYAGEEMAEQTGTVDQPRCTFTPVTEGGPAFDVNYLWFDGPLAEALDSVGRVPGVVTEVDVPGAEAARLVVHARRPAVFVTGFVQSGGLVQSVNAVQLRPYDESTVVHTTRRLLADLVAQAPADSSTMAP